MHTSAIVIITLIWLAGTGLRIYRQARYFQIEEYMNQRYIRWWLNHHEHTAPKRVVIAALVGSALALFLGEAPNSPLPGIIGVIAALISTWPPDEGEIKKRFRRTSRAMRILVSAITIMGLGLIILAIIVTQSISKSLGVPLLTLLGAGVFLMAPIWLVLGNIIMTPVEAFMRRRFIAAARHVIAAIQPKVIGITGSYGKTTTKNFLNHFLNGRYHAYATPRSYNTMMGVCLAINNDLKNDYSVDYFLVEMGAYIRGEIKRICGLTPPDIAILVEVGPQHLERFGSLENIATAKYEIITELPPDGVGVFNWDNPHIREMYQRGYPRTRLAVSKSVAPDAAPADGPRFIASEIQETLQGLSFTVTDISTGESQPFFAPVLGEHNVTNILLATAVAIHEGMRLQDVAFRARSLEPAESRLISQNIGGITIINDAYSANPAGIVSALRVLGMHTTGRRLLITPGMVELGEVQDAENHKLGQLAAQHATDIILVGTEQTRAIKAGIDTTDFPQENVQIVEELRDAVTWYQYNLKPGDTVLFLNDLPDTY